MASDPNWDDIFRPATADPVTPQSTATGVTDAGGARESAPEQPTTRRAAREGEQAPPRQRTHRTSAKVRKRRANVIWAVILVLVFGGIAAGGVAVWVTYEDKIREVLGIAPPIDYSGSGNGEEIVVVIESGDIGSDVAAKLHDAGVTMTYQAFYELLLESPEVTFEPGNYRLQGEMSAASALSALQDPANKLINQVTIPEGVSAASALELIASATEIPLEELQAQAANFTQFGVPASAPSIEGYLFPATYSFDPGITATDAIQQLVTTMFQKLDEAGVAEADRYRVLTMASIIQRESGPNVADMPKISRVFQNRIDRGMLLQSDATVHYGIGDTSTVWTTPEDRADASNPYNTYANPGLPIGPIGLPGVDAINAAVAPADGTWLYFVTVNLQTGETAFNNTLAEHDRDAQKLYDWCEASDENAAYC